MKLDFYHNKIVADIISEEFELCFERELIPILIAKYGDIDALQMYEDYIADELLRDGYWYYPLSVVVGGEIKTQWVRWKLDKKDFDDGLPYAFSGRGSVGFELCEGPADFVRRIAGRSRYYAGGSVNVRIEVVKGDAYHLSGRYSQTFIDEMARQLTPAIESATGVTGIADSTVELVMVFASGTYMEHISENVTYRRLMLVDKVSAPRDFWIKWTRLDGAVAHPVSAHVSAENILFELGEDVDHKIREKEYRYLLSSSGERYHNSMGRKKVTEWREVIKRAARRGELTKVESDYELAPETLELEERIADLLGKKPAPKSEPEREEIPYISEETPEDDEFARAMEKARMVVEGSTDEESEERSLDEITDEIPDEIPDVTSDEVAEDKPAFVSSEDVVEFDEGDDAEDVEIDFEADEPLDEEDKEVEDSEEADEVDIFADTEAEDEEPEISVEIVCEGAEDEPEDEPLVLEEPAEEFIINEEPEEELVIEESDEEFLIGEEESEDEESAEELPEDGSDEEFIIGEAVAEDEAVEPVVDPVAEPEPVIEPVAEATVEETPVEASAEPEIISEPVVEPEPVVESEPVVEPVAEPERKPVAEHHPVAHDYTEPGLAERVADIRAEVETKIRLEYEVRAREKAERELEELRERLHRLETDSELTIAELRSENERLRRECDRLVEQIEGERFARESEEARRRIEEKQLREDIEKQLRAEAEERERLAENARVAVEEQRRLEAENARLAREREEEARAEAERAVREEEERRLEAERIRIAERERIQREQEEARQRAKNAMPDMGDGSYSYTTKVVKLVFPRSVDPNIITRIHQLIKTTVDYYGKDDVSLRIRATIPDNRTVLLEFIDIPLEEMPLLGNIIKVLGHSGLGIIKAIIE